MRAAEALLPAMVEATGAESDGIFRRDTYTGLNWSEVPSILVEMGFMTNEERTTNSTTPPTSSFWCRAWSRAFAPTWADKRMR